MLVIRTAAGVHIEDLVEPVLIFRRKSISRIDEVDVTFISFGYDKLARCPKACHCIDVGTPMRNK
jgi:hypothetical protein